MAKTETKSAFTFEDFAVPPKGAFGGTKAETKVLHEKLAAVPVGKSFMAEEANVPDTITDAVEREKAVKEELNRINNRVTSSIRRFKAADTSRADWEFEQRKVNDEKLGCGVRIWRTK